MMITLKFLLLAYVAGSIFWDWLMPRLMVGGYRRKDGAK